MKEPDDQVAATSAWADITGSTDIIGSISDPSSPWVRLQWRDATAPVDSGALASFTADAMCPAARRFGTPEHAARTTYERLTRQAAPASESHQVLLCLALYPKRLARQVKDAGRGDQTIAAVVLRHLEQFAYKLAASDILVEGILTPPGSSGRCCVSRPTRPNGSDSPSSSPPAAPAWPGWTRRFGTCRPCQSERYAPRSGRRPYARRSDSARASKNL